MTEIATIKNAQRLIHGYNEVNYTFVWEVVENDLLKLEEKVRKILQGLNLPKDFTSPEF